MYGTRQRGILDDFYQDKTPGREFNCMRKQLDLTKYYVRLDKGREIVYIQNGEEFDSRGYSFNNYDDILPEPDFTEVQEKLEASLEEKRGLILANSGKPFSSLAMGEQCLLRKKLSLEEYEVIPYKGGYAISKKN